MTISIVGLHRILIAVNEAASIDRNTFRFIHTLFLDAADDEGVDCCDLRTKGYRASTHQRQESMAETSSENPPEAEAEAPQPPSSDDADKVSMEVSESNVTSESIFASAPPEEDDPAAAEQPSKLPPKKRGLASSSPSSTTPTRESRRPRKAVEALVPTLNDAASNNKSRLNGRGTPLNALCRKPLEAASLHSLLSLYRLLLITRAVPKRKTQLLEGLLEFNGYLPQGGTEDEDEAMEVSFVCLFRHLLLTLSNNLFHTQTKYALRAYKLKKAEILTIYEALGLERGSASTGKDDLAEHLLEFLSEPSRSKYKAVPGERVIEEGGEDENREDDEFDLPTETQLRAWVQAYAACFNMKRMTTQHAIETASDKFGVDISSQKELLKELFVEELPEEA